VGDPGTIEAEITDVGSEGIAFHDTTVAIRALHTAPALETTSTWEHAAPSLPVSRRLEQSG